MLFAIFHRCIQLLLSGTYVTTLCPASFPLMSHLFAEIRGQFCKKNGNERSTATFTLIKTGTILLYFAKKKCKKIGSAVRKLQACKDSDCMFCARVRKTSGARNCCVPELLALKGLILVTIMNDFAGHFSIRV